MKKNINIFIFFLLASTFYVFFNNAYYHKIIESDQLSTVLNYIEPSNTLVIFDIDNTLAHPTQDLGSDEWFSYKVDEKIAQGCDPLTAVYYALPKAFYAQFNIPLEPTEPNIPQLITSLIDKGVAVIALSTRSLFIAERTVEQLDNININFFIPDVSPDDLVLPMTYPCFYKRGILFSGNNDKGETLRCFLATMNYHPKKIIFVDDKIKYLLSVEKALKSLNIPFVGIRYSRCDEQVKNFNPTKSEAQWYKLKEQNRCLAKKQTSSP